MPTPNWGPQKGVEMDQATFDAYVAANPPGSPNSQGLYGTSRPWRQQGGAAPAPRIPQAGGAPNQNSDYWSSLFMQGAPPVNMPGFQTGNSDQARLQQQQVIQDLQRAAAGDRNSQAQQQLAQAYGGAQQQQASLGSTMRGQSAGAAMRGVQAGQQGIQRGLAGDQQMLMLQEQQAAQQMLAQLLAQQQGQDITQATGVASGVNQGNAMNDAMSQFYAQQGSNLNMQQGQIGVERQAALHGFDLQNQDTTNRLLRNGANAAAGALSTYGSMDNRSSSQKKIDDAFNGG